MKVPEICITAFVPPASLPAAPIPIPPRYENQVPLASRKIAMPVSALMASITPRDARSLRSQVPSLPSCWDGSGCLSP